MRPAERLALTILLGLAVLTFGTAGAAVYAWHEGGVVRLAVHDPGTDGLDMNVSLPGALVNAAIALCPVPSDLRRDPRLAGVLPALKIASDKLATMPDAVLVDVHDHGESVRITKSGRELLVHVDSRDERVDLAFPIDSLRRLLTKLDASRTA